MTYFFGTDVDYGMMMVRMSKSLVCALLPGPASFCTVVAIFFSIFAGPCAFAGFGAGALLYIDCSQHVLPEVCLSW